MLRRLGVVLLLLAALAAAGAANYRRNLEREGREPRPFRSYAAAELETLARAYEREVAALETRYRAQRDAGGAAPAGGPLLGEKVRAFEQVSARTQAVRGLGGELSMKEAALADVRAEQARRGVDPLQVHLKRLLTF
jgi:hypothetical protein